MIKESGIMAEIHEIRERFYQKTKNISHVELLNLIRTQSKNVEEELFQIRPSQKLVVRKRYKVPEPEAMKEIHQIREHGVSMGMYNMEYQTWCLRHCDTTEVA